MTVLSVRDLGKSFRSYRSEWQRFGRWFGLPFQPVEEHWVLRHLSFDVEPGEAVGIVGENGAGKSTLLKMITGTLQPSEGAIAVNARIAAILELGMGFNPELTGRQNVRHAAGLMGLPPGQIDQIMPDVEAFAEVGEYFDEPVRTYSSGMQMRVAFSVATAVRPEILIVDEALSVGDTYFQHKSFDRIRQFREQGTTLLMVSHDRTAIQSLCDRALLLEQGQVIKDGRPEEVMDFYNALIAEKENSTIEVTSLPDGKAQTRSGTGEARVLELALYNSKGEPADHIGVGEEVELRARVAVQESIDSLVFGYGIRDRLGQVIYGTNTWFTDQLIEAPCAGEEYAFRITFPANLGVGSYSVQTALVGGHSHLVSNYEWRDMALLFNVVNLDKPQFDGCAWHESTIHIERWPA